MRLFRVFLVGLTFGLILASSDAAFANNFSKIAGNITTSIADLPGLLSGVAYMMGILIGVIGILKIKDHVENPGQVKLKDGAIRLAAGGGLFALPIVYEAMRNTIGSGNGVGVASIAKVTMGSAASGNGFSYAGNGG